MQAAPSAQLSMLHLTQRPGCASTTVRLRWLLWDSRQEGRSGKGLLARLSDTEMQWMTATRQQLLSESETLQTLTLGFQSLKGAATLIYVERIS